MSAVSGKMQASGAWPDQTMNSPVGTIYLRHQKESSNVSIDFASFHYDRDYARVQQVLNMGAIEGQTIVSSQKWEEVKRNGKAAVEKWIDDQMKGKSAVVVLVGAETASREWVNYEIRKAWNSYKPIVGHPNPWAKELRFQD